MLLFLVFSVLYIFYKRLFFFLFLMFRVFSRLFCLWFLAVPCLVTLRPSSKVFLAALLLCLTYELDNFRQWVYGRKIFYTRLQSIARSAARMLRCPMAWFAVVTLNSGWKVFRR